MLPDRYPNFMRFFLYFFFIMSSATTTAQIVNIESQRMQSDTTGLKGSLGSGFLYQKNVVSVLSINVNTHVQYKTKRDLYLFLANYNLLKGSGRTLTDNLFYHVRYNHKLNTFLRWEVFTQLQQNNVTGIRLRLLTGSGPRFKLSGAPKFALYAATAVMYEYEEEQTRPAAYHRDLRSSNYVSFTYKPLDNMECIGTLFYQPLYRNLRDYRLLNEVSVRLKIVTRFSFTAGWYYLYDSHPAAPAPGLNYSISNGLLYDF